MGGKYVELAKQAKTILEMHENGTLPEDPRDHATAEEKFMKEQFEEFEKTHAFDKQTSSIVFLMDTVTRRKDRALRKYKITEVMDVLKFASRMQLNHEEILAKPFPLKKWLANPKRRSVDAVILDPSLL